MTQRPVRSKNVIAEIVDNCTLEAKNLLDCALQIATKNRNRECGAEHLALALVNAGTNTDVALILGEWPVDINRFTGQINNQIKCLETYSLTTQKTSIYFSEFFREFLQRADMISGSFGWPAIRSGALFLSFLEITVERRQHRFFVELARLPIEEIKEFLRHQCPDLESKPGSEASKSTSSETGSSAMGEEVLKKFTVDLTAQARAGKIDPISSREKEIFECIDILLRKGQNNPILTGEAGVGKTAIVEGLALRIVQKSVPPPLQNVTIRTLDLGLLQAGASVKGEFEDRLKKILEAIQSSPNPIILFIDEAHTMIGAGAQAGQNDVANLLKPALARGELRTIAATTWAEYKKYFEKDSALARRFQVIKVEEPTPEMAVHMLRGMCRSLEKHHKVVILEEALPTAVRLSARFLNDRKLPDKALRVLDTACARVNHSQTSIPAQLLILEAEINQLLDEENRITSEIENGYTDSSTDLFEVRSSRAQKQAQKLELERQLSVEKALIAELLETRNKLKLPGASAFDRESLREKLTSLKEQLSSHQNQNPLIYPWVDSQTVASIVQTWTGIPNKNLVDDEIADLLGLAGRIARRVIGQDYAIEEITNRIQVSRTGLTDPNKPIGVFLLCGPSGVGKTETALAIADIVYGSEKKLITINMSEYQEAHTVSQLKGSPPGYVGCEEGGRLTEAVRRNPYSVVLLDEIEKAHKDVVELFFQVFDRGMMEDGCGTEVNFKNCIFLLTTNLGDRCVEESARSDSFSEEPRSELTEDPELNSNSQSNGAENESVLPVQSSIVDLGQLQKQLYTVLVRHFPAAFLGRVQVIPYFPMSSEMLRSIVTLQINKISNRIWDYHKIRLVIEPSVLDMICARCLESQSGARNAAKIIENNLLPPISSLILQSQYERSAIAEIEIGTDSDGFVLTSSSSH